MVIGKIGQIQAKAKVKAINPMMMAVTNLSGKNAILGFKLGPLWPRKI